MLYLNTKNRLLLGQAYFFMISENPNLVLEIADCSFYARRIALKDDHNKKRMEMLAYTPVNYKYLTILAKNFIILARQNQFIQENNFNNDPVRRIAIAVNTKSAFSGS